MDKLPPAVVRKVDKALAENQKAWEELKKVRARANTSQELDQAFYRFIKVWLDTDRAVDEGLQAHALSYWKDPQLKPILERCSQLNFSLARLQGGRKAKMLARVNFQLEGLIRAATSP